MLHLMKIGLCIHPLKWNPFLYTRYIFIDKYLSTSQFDVIYVFICDTVYRGGKFFFPPSRIFYGWCNY